MSGSVVASGVILLLTFVLMARYLGVALFGDLIVIITISSLFQLFADGGIVSVTIRDVARDGARRGEILGSTLTFAWLVSGLLFALLVLAVELFDPAPRLHATIYLMTLAALWALQGSLQTGIIRAFEDMGLVALVGVAHKLLLLALLAAAIHFDTGITGVAGACVAANVAQWALLLLLVRIRYCSYRPRVDLAHWRYLAREALPLGAGVVLRRLTIHMHTLLLTVLSGTVAVGLFNSAYRFLQMAEIGALTLASVLFPALSRLRHSSMTEFERLYGDGVRMMVVLAAVPAGVFVALGNEWALALYGEQYAAAGPVLQVLAASLVFLVPGALLHSGFAALDRQGLFMRLSALGIVTNAVLGVLLIRRFGALGAAYATLGTELVTLIAGAWLLRSQQVRPPYIATYLRAALPAALIAGVVCWFRPIAGWAALSTATVAFGAAFSLAVVLTGAVRPRELRALAAR
jgi:O-antigen/teichoic acid export membrane protein